MRYLLFVLVIIVMMGAAETECETPPPQPCPTVGEKFRTSHHLSLSTRSAIQDLLADPGSYEFLDMTPQSESTFESSKRDTLLFLNNEIQNPDRIWNVSYLEKLSAAVEDEEEEEMIPVFEFTIKRAGGRSSYHNYVAVDFTAKNASGGRVAGTADVLLIEKEEDGCVAFWAEPTG